MTVLFQSEHAVLEVDHATHVVRYTRSAVPFTKVEDAATMFRAIGTSTTPIDRSRYVLLSDVRSAPGRNDPAFESAIAHYRNELFGGFAKRATLVKTMAGELQIKRLNREQRQTEIRVFHDEAEALAYLKS